MKTGLEKFKNQLENWMVWARKWPTDKTYMDGWGVAVYAIRDMVNKAIDEERKEKKANNSWEELYHNKNKYHLEYADKAEEKSLAELAGEKNMCIRFIGMACGWNIHLKHEYGLTRRFNSETYAECEAKAIKFLEDL